MKPHPDLDPTKPLPHERGESVRESVCAGIIEECRAILGLKSGESLTIAVTRLRAEREQNARLREALRWIGEMSEAPDDEVREQLTDWDVADVYSELAAAVVKARAALRANGGR